MHHQSFQQQQLHRSIPKNSQEKNFIYYLTWDPGADKKYKAAEIVFEYHPTWKQITESAIEYCQQYNIPLTVLAEKSGIRHGFNGDPHEFPIDAQKYILSKLPAVEEDEMTSEDIDTVFVEVDEIITAEEDQITELTYHTKVEKHIFRNSPGHQADDDLN